MDEQAQQLLRRLIRGQRVAALGTLRRGAPYVSLVPYVPAPDFSAFYMHISFLAHHTRNIEADPRVSFMIAAPDGGGGSPLALPRITMRGRASVLGDEPDAAAARALYLNRFPEAARTFMLRDFALFGIFPDGARFVAGFGKTFNLKPDALVDLAGGDP